jgi:hypothetical protein
MNALSSSEIFIGMAGICLDRLLKQRFALRKPGFWISATSRRFKEFIDRGGLPHDEISSSCRTFIPSPTNSWSSMAPKDQKNYGAIDPEQSPAERNHGEAGEQRMPGVQVGTRLGRSCRDR